MALHSGLELADSRVSGVKLDAGVAHIHFSHAYVHRSAGAPGRDPGSGWSLEAEIIIHDATLLAPLPPLPATAVDGELEVGGHHHEILPLPFHRKGPIVLSLLFDGGGELRIAGGATTMELLSDGMFLE